MLKTTKMNLYVWTIAVFAAFGGFMFGYDIGVINGVKEMTGFRQTFNLSYSEEDNATGATCSEGVAESTILGLIVSTFSLGCLVGALCAGAVSDWLGRKPAIMLGGVAFIIGGILQSSSFFLWMIIIGRIVAGTGVGVLSTVVPIYNAELAPKNLRGRLVSLNQLAITAGIMISFLVDLVCERFLVGWRVALALQSVFGSILLVGMIFLPETPRWLVKKHKDVRAAKVLKRLRNIEESAIQEELAEIQSTVKVGGGDLWYAWRILFNWKMIQRVMTGVLLQVFQQFVGVNVIFYYSTSIFCKIGVAEYVSTAVVGSINFLSTILAIVLVDKVGRKALLLTSSLGMLVAMVTAASLIVGFGLETEGEGEGGGGAVGAAVVVFVCLFVFFFACGWGPVAWVVTSEMFPLSVRGVAVSITTAANWTGNFVVAMLTPILLASPLQTHGTFYLISGSLALSFLFVLLALPETKGESLERIEEIFAQPWLKRVNIVYYLRCGCPWRRSAQQYSLDGRAHIPISVETDNESNDDQTLLLKDKDSSHSEQREVGAYTDEL